MVAVPIPGDITAGGFPITYARFTFSRAATRGVFVGTTIGDFRWLLGKAMTYRPAAVWICATFGIVFLGTVFLGIGDGFAWNRTDGDTVFIPCYLTTIRKLTADTGFAKGVFGTSHVPNLGITTGRWGRGCRTIQAAGLGGYGTVCSPG